MNGQGARVLLHSFAEQGMHARLADAAISQGSLKLVAWQKAHSPTSIWQPSSRYKLAPNAAPKELLRQPPNPSACDAADFAKAALHGGLHELKMLWSTMGASFLDHSKPLHVEQL